MSSLLSGQGRAFLLLLCCPVLVSVFASVFPVVFSAASLAASPAASPSASPAELATQGGGRAEQCSQAFEPASGSYDFVQDEQPASLPDGSASIRKIHITRLEVFDESNPKESNWLYGVANDIHILSREELIRRLLLFQEGDAYDPRLIRETERLLRAQEYFFDAAIRLVNVCEGEVELEVITRDVWSLNADASIERTGGETDYSFGVRDTNLLGRGSTFGIRRKRDKGLDSTELAFRNNNIGGSRVATHLVYTDLETGTAKRLQLAMPFYALDARRAWAVVFHEFDRAESQYLRGREVTEVRHDAIDYLASYGFSEGVQDGKVKRWVLGARRQESVFSHAGGKLPAPSPFPEDRKLTWPYLEFAVTEDRFQKRVNLDQIYRTEDVNTGYQFFIRAGYAAEALGSNADRAVFEGNYSDTLIADDKSLLGHRLGWQGYYNNDSGRAEDVLVNYVVRYLRHRTQKVSLLARLEASWADNLNTNQQIVLGGDTGARAFDNRFQVGDRKLLLTLERRHFTDYHFFNLIRMGWVAFVDLGRAWDPGVPDPFADDYLANVGLGLRLTSSKSDTGRVMHIDLAFPLTNRDDRDVDSYELTVRVTNRF